MSARQLCALIGVGLLAAGACGGPMDGAVVDGGPVGTCPEGIDLDHDGYGVGCMNGPDCDDGDAAIQIGCGCVVGEAAPGCPCDPAATPVTTCFSGTPEQAATPPCRKGSMTCSERLHSWGVCEGEVAPGEERCDGLDNDCDAEIDDGVLSMCGDCTPGCDKDGWGDTTPFPFPPALLPPGTIEVEADGVGLDPMGDLVLDETNIEYHFLWVANSGAGTVSKLDTITGREVGRYCSVTHASVVDHMGGGSGGVPACGGGNSPSRTAVDFFGNVWVANRAFDYQPSATKIMNDVADCIDRNGDGVIQTSTDVDGDGVISLAMPEFFGEDDECIRFTVIVGSYNGWARAAAIDAGDVAGDPGDAWIGIFNQQRFYQLDGATGALKSFVDAGVTAYGAAIDSMGYLYAPNGCCGRNRITKIDTATSTVVGSWEQPTWGCGGSYGITVDTNDKVWLGGWPCAAGHMFDPVTTVWTQVPVPGYFGAGWGARGVGADGEGNIWLALHPHSFSNAGALGRVNTTTFAVSTFDLNGLSTPATSEGVPVGAAVDFDGNIWTVNQNTANASRLFIDPITHEPAAHPGTGNTVDTFPVGAAPYTYSDFTGFGLRTVTRPTGDYTVVFEGCGGGEPAHWDRVDYTATAPPGTAVEIWVRVGNDLVTLDAQPMIGPWTIPPANLQAPPGPVPDGRYLQLIVRLISIDRETTPIVHSLAARWACPTLPIE